MLDGIMQNTIDQAGSRLQTYAPNGMISLAGDELEERPCRDWDETHTHTSWLGGLFIKARAYRL